jgi:hypothetical protein
MVSIISNEPIFTPNADALAWGAMLMDSCPPATTMSLSPLRIA